MANKRKIKIFFLKICIIIAFSFILVDSSKCVFVRFCGEKKEYIVEYVYSNTPHSTHAISKVTYNDKHVSVVYCPLNIKVGAIIEVYQYRNLEYFVCTKISRGAIVWEFLGIILSLSAIISCFFIDYGGKE